MMWHVSQVSMRLTDEKPMTAATKQHAERHQHAEDPLARDVDVQQDLALEWLLAGHHSPAPMAVDDGDADGSLYLTPLKSW